MSLCKFLEMNRSSVLQTARVCSRFQRLKYPSLSFSTSSEPLTWSKYEPLRQLGITDENPGLFNGKWGGSGGLKLSINPATNQPIARVRSATIEDYVTTVQEMDKVREMWANLPAPARGEVVRKIGDALREKKHALGLLVSLGGSLLATLSTKLNLLHQKWAKSFQKDWEKCKKRLIFVIMPLV